MKTAAIVAAGGSGSRLGSSLPKQFVELAGKPLLAHTVARFERSPVVDGFVLVLPMDGFDGYARLMSRWVSSGKLLAVIPGGEERQESVWNGLEALPRGFAGVVAVHDGARPLVGEALIRASVEAAERYGGALVALPVLETLKEAGPDDFVAATLDRRKLYRAQTPQSFRYSILRNAFEQARVDGFRGTDEAALAERIGARVAIVMGSERNIKVTTAEDLALAEYYLRLEARD